MRPFSPPCAVSLRLSGKNTGPTRRGPKSKVLRLPDNRVAMYRVRDRKSCERILVNPTSNESPLVVQQAATPKTSQGAEITKFHEAPFFDTRPTSPEKFIVTIHTESFERVHAVPDYHYTESADIVVVLKVRCPKAAVNVSLVCTSAAVNISRASRALVLPA